MQYQLQLQWMIPKHASIPNYIVESCTQCFLSCSITKIIKLFYYHWMWIMKKRLNSYIFNKILVPSLVGREFFSRVLTHFIWVVLKPWIPWCKFISAFSLAMTIWHNQLISLGSTIMIKSYSVLGQDLPSAVGRIILFRDSTFLRSLVLKLCKWSFRLGRILGWSFKDGFWSAILFQWSEK